MIHFYILQCALVYIQLFLAGMPPHVYGHGVCVLAKLYTLDVGIGCINKVIRWRHPQMHGVSVWLWPTQIVCVFVFVCVSV